jgi:N-acetylmuramoyl-L-alanine amidase
MKFYTLLFSFLTFLLATAPAYAGKLMFWRFEPNQNRLVFSTDQGIQPTAQLISNPTRLVIDLPGTVLGRPTINENFSGVITNLRIGQFDARTTRLVVELAPGYTLDPQKIKIKGISPTQWTVDLPQPQRGTLTPPPSSPASPYDQSRRFTPIPTTPSTISASNSIITTNSNNQNYSNSNSGLRVTSSGLILDLNGNHTNQITVNRSRNRRQIEFELKNVTVPSNLATSWKVEQYGIKEIEIAQSKKSPSVALVTLNVDYDSPDWQASFSRMGGLVLWPQGGVARVANKSNYSNSQPQPRNQPAVQPVVANNNNSVSSPLLATQKSNQKTKIESIELNHNQLIIKGNQKLDAQGNWNQANGVYEIRLPNTDLAPNFKTPQLPAGSPVARMRIWQPNGDTVVLLVQPAVGVRVNQLNQPSDQMLALSLTQYSSARNTTPQALPLAVIPAPRTSSPYNSSLSTNPLNVTPSNTSSWKPSSNYRPSKSKTLVVIDPGHGGKDPGAIGIGGIQEKHIVMAISQEVARLLEQQGIQVKLTRGNDYFVSLQGRTEMANRIDADLFISIHANSAGMNKPHVSGLETYYFQSGRNLASVIHRNVLRRVNVNDRKVRQARFYVLRKSAMPAVLVETGFVTGTEDAAKLKNSWYQKQMAQGIASGIIEYIKANRL